MAINRASVSISGIKQFLDLFRDPNASINAFQAALQQRLGGPGGGIAAPPAGEQPGPTREAAARQETGPNATDRHRALLETIFANPALVADLPSDAFDRMVGASEGLMALETGPEPSPELQRVKEFESRGGQLSPQQLGQALDVLPNDTSDMIELAAINAARKLSGQPEYGIEEGLRVLANLRAAQGTTVNVSPIMDLGIGEFFSKFTQHQEAGRRRDQLSLIEPTLAQLRQAKGVLDTPGVMSYLATSGVGRTVGAGLATFQSLTGRRPFEAFDASTLGATQAALDTGISLAATTLARLGENDISEPTRKRLMEIAQVGSFLSNPEQARGAINELIRIIEQLQTQTSEELRVGGRKLGDTNEPTPEPPNRAAGRNAIRAKAKELYRANPDRYDGEKDPQLLLDAVQAVDRDAKLQIE